MCVCVCVCERENILSAVLFSLLPQIRTSSAQLGRRTEMAGGYCSDDSVVIIIIDIDVWGECRRGQTL